MTKLTIEVEGLDKVQAAMNKYALNLKKRTQSGMERVVLHLQAESQKLAPIDTGDLRGSAYSKVEMGPDGAVGTVGFGVPYALYQHENLELHHSEGQSKFLEAPLKRNVHRYVSTMAREFEKAKP